MDGFYAVDILIDWQKQRMIVDTGSHMVVSTCNSC